MQLSLQPRTCFVLTDWLSLLSARKGSESGFLTFSKGSWPQPTRLAMLELCYAGSCQ